MDSHARNDPPVESSKMRAIAGDQDIAGERYRRSQHDPILFRQAVTLPVEIYSERRIREFDASEEELARAMHSPRRPTPRTARRKRRA